MPRAARTARLSGHVSVGMAPSTLAVLGPAFMLAMRERYPDIRLHLVESLSGGLAAMIGARQLDLGRAVPGGTGPALERAAAAGRTPVRDCAPRSARLPAAKTMRLDDIGDCR
jgi:LysR family tcuABC transcriptional regulator